MDGQEIIARLNERAEDFCTWLLPQGKRVGMRWTVGSIKGDEGKSLKIELEGEKVGVWADFAAGSDVRGGNLVSLLMRVRGTTNWGKSLWEAREWLGVPSTEEEDRLFRQRTRNRGKFETPSDVYEALNPLGPVFEYLTTTRRLSAHILRQYRVCQNKRIAAAGFPHFSADAKALRAVKYQDIQRAHDGTKREPWKDPQGSRIGLWGKEAVSPENGEIVICEGEIDAMSVAEVGFSGVSMPNGTQDQGWIEQDWRWLQQFAGIILCYDNDAAGASGLDRAFPTLVSRLGRARCRIARLPAGIKDPNDALQQGRQDELVESLTNAQSIDPEPLRNASEYRQEVHDLFFPPDGAQAGLAIPWTHELRLRPAEVTLWTGINGHGKTTLLLHCIAHLCHTYGERAIVASMEAPVRQSARIFCRQIAGGEIKGTALFERAYAALERQVWFYDHVGNASWKDLIETFRYAWRRYGVTQFVVDSLMTCSIETDDFNEQSRFVGELAALAAETGGHVHVVAHARKGSDESEPPGKMDVAGHANLTNRVFNGLTVWRNKAKTLALNEAYESRVEDQIRRAHALHDAELFCWKQRETGDEFFLRLWRHKDSLQFWPSAHPAGKNYLTVE